jgi:hypothetical protein
MEETMDCSFAAAPQEPAANEALALLGARGYAVRCIDRLKRGSYARPSDVVLITAADCGLFKGHLTMSHPAAVRAYFPQGKLWQWMGESRLVTLLQPKAHEHPRFEQEVLEMARMWSSWQDLSVLPCGNAPDSGEELAWLMEIVSQNVSAAHGGGWAT